MSNIIGIRSWISTDSGKFAADQLIQAYQFWFGSLMDYGAISEFYSNVNYAYDWIAFNVILANAADGTANFSAAKQGELVQLLEVIRQEALTEYGNNVQGANYLWLQFCQRSKVLTNNPALQAICQTGSDGSKAATKYTEDQTRGKLDLPWYIWLIGGVFLYKKIRS